MDAIGFALVGIGAYLLYAALKNFHPLTAAKATIASNSPQAPTAPTAATTTGG